MVTKFVTERFKLNQAGLKRVWEIKPQFGYNGFGEIIYYLHYSRRIGTNRQESWHDTVARVINGVFSIRKDWYVRNRIAWREEEMQRFAANMAVALCRMEWLPPGRGLWAMGTDLVYDRGGMALLNCAYTDVGASWVDDVCWIMDVLMYGVGVGFGPVETGLQLKEPDRTKTFTIPDSREGWVESLRLLLLAFTTGHTLPNFNYDLIRPSGEPIKTFGGTASGPEPLKRLHATVTELCYRYVHQSPPYTEIQFKTDLANLVGVCVITGNVRRSAEIALGEADDEVFWDLKNYAQYPERAEWGWMSNNSIKLRERNDFEKMEQIAFANVHGHDVGYVNMRNLPHGRIGKFDEQLPKDKAVGLNPCGEIPLESREVCNLAETLPTRCSTVEKWLEACDYATFYCTTVTLLPTHQPSTNAVVNRNRRIGVSLVDIAGWFVQEGVARVTSYMRDGYKRIREFNSRLSAEAGVPPAIRVTTVKPGGTTPKLAGRSSGVSNPTFRYTLRRINVRSGSPIERRLRIAGVPNEPSVYTPNTTIFEYPIEQGPADPATHVSVWEQAMNVVLVQREWADNAVSNTIYFKPRWVLIKRGNLNDDPKVNFDGHDLLPLYRTGEDEIVIGDLRVSFDRETDDYSIYRFDPNNEEAQLEPMLAAIAPYTKSVSLLPHTAQGVFRQMPEEGLTKAEFDERVDRIKPINWDNYFGTDGQDEKYCTGNSCEVNYER